MGPKKGQKRTEETNLAAEGPFALESAKALAKWTERVSVVSRKIQQVQHVLSLLSSQMEGCNKELADVYESASLLTALRIVEYRQKLNPHPPGSPAKKQRLKRESSVKSLSQPLLAENSTEALLAAMDERRRLRVSGALVSLFKRNNTESPVLSSPTYAAAVPGGGGTANFAEAVGRQQVTAPSSLPTDIGSASTNVDQRRPKDVPPELWEEVSKLRLKRLTLEGRGKTLMSNIDAQLARFDLLMQNHGIATYATDELEQTLQKLRLGKSTPEHRDAK
ncbi:uncharacterized protein Tco025E_08278 [Trypanosoma conorhini]|uniref:Uncharacterized protein n=1 Tax=Trypanosoma conorhini TaxID=83891 RepID=A0A422NCE0_9TRYP|nr:uncharacterized protein Tco025E_08278 [Trypanosoma conorhini]RNF02979.1 hypothetical protein Tco025E_08278 [Trypanosoma conorhini]